MLGHGLEVQVNVVVVYVPSIYLHNVYHMYKDEEIKRLTLFPYISHGRRAKIKYKNMGTATAIARGS